MEGRFSFRKIYYIVPTHVEGYLTKFSRTIWLMFKNQSRFYEFLIRLKI